MKNQSHSTRVDASCFKGRENGALKIKRYFKQMFGAFLGFNVTSAYNKISSRMS